MQINQHIAVISGGASGMGAATANHLAQLGAQVVILDLNLELAKKVADSIHGLAIACDVTNAGSVEHAFDEIKKTVGVPRFCVNCAGIAPGKLVVGKEGGAMPLSDFSQVIEINLIGTFNVMRLAAAGMSRLEPIGDSQERGVIINTASIAAYEGQMGQTAYSASKGGVVAMTLPAARELARYGIRVMSIAPGLIETPLFEGLTPQVRESLTESVPFPKRLGHPQEYAALVQHIIQNSLLNGCTIRLDAALRMGSR